MRRGELGKVLVTGGGGFLGSSLIKPLRERGLAVRSLARQFYPHLQELDVEQVQGDIADPADRRPRRRGLHDGLSYRGQGRSLGPGARVPTDQRRRDPKPDRGLSRTRRAPDHLHEFPQRGLYGSRYGERR